MKKGGDLLPPGPTAFVVQQLERRAPALHKARAELEKATKGSRVLALIRLSLDAGEITREDIQRVARTGEVTQQDMQRLAPALTRARAFSRVIYGDADASDPQVVRIAFIYQGTEHESAIAPPGTDHRPLLDELIRLMNLPIEAVRAYRGSVLLEERTLSGSGSDNAP